MSPPLRVAVGTTSLIRPLTGIGQYTLHLTQELRRMADFELHYFYGYDWGNAAEPREVAHLPLIKGMVKKLFPRPYEVGRAIQRNRFKLGAKARKPQVYHEPNFLPVVYDVPYVLTIHDLSYLRYPETHPELRVRVMNKLLPASIARAAHLVTDSEFTRQEVIGEFGIAEDRVTTTLLGTGGEFRPRSELQCGPVLKIYDLRYQGFVLAVGTFEPRKNLVQIIRAYTKLDPATARRFPLAIAGGKGWKSEETERELAPLIADRRAIRLGFIPEEHLPILYSAARMLAYPSLYEGFGLPAAEAMASGTPVVTSDRASLPEVVGDAGIQIAPEDVDGLRDAVLSVLEDDKLHENLSARGLERARTLTWSRCAQQTANIYRRIAGRPEIAYGA